MLSPEQIEHQSFELYAPIDKVGGISGSIEPDNPQKGIFPKSPDAEEEQLVSLPPESSDRHYSYTEQLNEKDDRPPIVGSQDRKWSESSIKQSRSSFEQFNSELDEWNEGPDNFIWTEDLSPNGQHLWLYLLGEGGVMEFLQWIASQEGWDLQAAIHELEANNVLDRSYPGRIRIIRKYRTDD